jgi:hypothetical protein
MPALTISGLLRPEPIPLGRFATRAFAASFSAYCLVAVAWWVWSAFFGSTPVSTPRALLWLVLQVLYYLFSFMAAYHTIFGEIYVSHDIVPHNIVSREVLVAAAALCALSVGARKLALGRLLAYTSIAALTVGGAVNYFGWIAQGL